MKNKKRKIFAFLISWILIIPIVAQNGINSPYSQFGVGELKTSFSHPYTNSMGGLSYTIRNNNMINSYNPASYTSIDSNSFVFDMGFGFDFITLSNKNESLYDADGALTHIMFGLPLTRWWKTSIGILPFSEVSYITTANKFMLENGDSLFSQTIFDGTGGITKLFWGHAFRITKNLSVGFNANYLFGKQTRAITYQFPDSSYFVNSRKLKETQINNLSFDFGLQYYHEINSDYTLGLGLVYSLPLKWKVKDKSVVYTFASSSVSDYVRDTVVPLAEYKSTLELPSVIGLGISITRNESWMLGIDATYSSWSMPKYTENTNTNIFGNWSAFDYKESFKFSLGGEKKSDRSATKYYERMSYRAGLHYEYGKLSVLNQNTGDFEIMNEFGVHAGISFPVRRMKSVINLTFQWSTLGIEDILKKNYFQIGVSFSTSDTWFKKRKYE